MQSSTKRPREAAVIYAENRLAPWGKWSRDNHEQLGLPRVSIIHKITRRRLVRGQKKNRSVLSAKGKETLSFRPRTVGVMPEAIAEVDRAVAAIPKRLRLILKIEYIHMPNSGIEGKCMLTRLCRKEYKERLCQAAYAVYLRLEDLTSAAFKC